jgi:hypothetical protein
VAQRKYQSNDTSLSPYIYPTEREALQAADRLIEAEKSSRPDVLVDQCDGIFSLSTSSGVILLEHGGIVELSTAVMLRRFALMMLKEGLPFSTISDRLRTLVEKSQAAVE